MLREIRAYLDEELPHVSDLVEGAFAEVDPVFNRERYGEFFWHCASTVPSWLAQVVLANSKAESDGSAKLLWLWQTTDANAGVEANLLEHARDEARHSQIFVGLADATFPGLFDDELLTGMRRGLTRISRRSLAKADELIAEELLMDHLVQMNMGEIRTRIHMELLSPLIHACAPQEAKDDVGDALQSLGGDEIRHISYTAWAMERWCEEGAKERIAALYRRRLQDFHELTVEETEGACRQFGQGRFPDLLEI